MKAWEIGRVTENDRDLSYMARFSTGLITASNDGGEEMLT